MRKIMPIVGGVLLGMGMGIVLFFVFFGDDLGAVFRTPATREEPDGVLAIDAPAPNFKLEKLHGETVHLEDYQGQIVLLNFWATWCAPCRLEMPTFQALSEAYPGQLAVVAVNNAESLTDVGTFVNEMEITFDVLLDPDGDVQDLYQVRGYPTSYVLDKEGIVRVQHIGLMTEEQLLGYLQESGLE